MSIGGEHLRASRVERQSVKLKNPNLPLLLLRGRERLLSYFRPILNAQGLTEQQWRILRVLLEESLEPRQICEVCCISSPSLVGVLARMHQLDLIHRSPVAGDQRRVLISVTSRARRLAAAIIPEIEGAYREIEARIGKPMLREMQNALEQLLSDLEPRLSERPESVSPPSGINTRGRRKPARSGHAGG
jgi:homoprotocatechuate degradation regulator HpaR